MAAAAPLPPAGTNFISAVQKTLIGVLLAQSFTVLLIPLTIALFWFSTPASRKKPIFILNIVAIALALTSGVLLIYRGITIILSPRHPPPLSLNLTVGVLGATQSIIVDIILLLRLISIYPRSYVGKTNFYSLIALPLLLKVGRVINLLMFIKVLADAARAPDAAARIGKLWLVAPYLKIEWFMQLFDNIYASGFFLWRLHLHQRETRETDSFAIYSRTRVSFGERLKYLFWIAVSNFIFPMLFSLVQIVIVYREVNFVIVNDIILANTMIAVIGVVFATVWAGSSHWKNTSLSASNGTASTAEGNTPQVMSEIVFSKRPDVSKSEVTSVPESEKNWSVFLLELV
ncbi:hypothetical protein PQX77_001346 [Marasmius sp. AFHP31]|nr:hypothetical protein PQX77_001346 [Marasmius sp. AFHP31]